jgi:hypothetical protein
MNAISLTVSVNVTDPKDLVLINQAMTHLMAELNSISSLSLPVKPVVVVDPVSGFVAKNPTDGIDVEAVKAKVIQAPKVKRPRTPAQLAHDAILRQQSIARHQALGHTVKVVVVDPKSDHVQSTRKPSKKAHEPVAICDICHKGYTSQAELMDHKAEKHPAKDESKANKARKVALNNVDPKPAKKAQIHPAPKPMPVKGRKVNAAPAAE